MEYGLSTVDLLLAYLYNSGIVCPEDHNDENSHKENAPDEEMNYNSVTTMSNTTPIKTISGSDNNKNSSNTPASNQEDTMDLKTLIIPHNLISKFQEIALPNSNNDKCERLQGGR